MGAIPHNFKTKNLPNSQKFTCFRIRVSTLSVRDLQSAMLHFTSLPGLLRVTARIFESHASKCLSAYVIPISCSTLTVFSARSPHKTRGSSDGRPPPRDAIATANPMLRLASPNLWLFVATHVVSGLPGVKPLQEQAPQSARVPSLQTAAGHHITCTMTPKHVHLQRGERLLWLDHRDDIIDHTHFLGPTDPESCYDTCDHFENMTLSRKLH